MYANNKKYYDFGAMAIISLLMVGVVFTGLTSSVAGIIVGLPFTLLLPGYALTAALFAKTTLGFTERCLFTLGLSLVTLTLSGLLLNLTPWGLQAGSWVIALSVITLAAGAVAIWRREQSPVGSPLTVTSAPKKFDTGFNLRQWLMLGAAGILVVAALGIAQQGAEQPGTTFTQLWLLPAQSAGSVEVGVTNDETVPLTYKVQVTNGTQVVQEWPAIPLNPGQTWQSSLTLPQNPTQNLTALLYRSDAPNTVYRTVTLTSAAATSTGAGGH